MKVRLVAYGIAKDILEGSSVDFELNGSPDIANLKEQITTQFPAFKDLASLKFAVNEEYREDSFAINENDEVVIIPPVSGG